MLQTKALIGIDWGTHSSKWTWTLSSPGTDEIVEGPYKILRSEVCLNENGTIFLSDEAPKRGTIYTSSIKGKFIKNPDAPFWTGPQRRIRLTLGELASFSLWSFLSEAHDDVCKSSTVRPEELEVRFSIPNWVDTQDGAAGRACYEQAARVACHLFEQDRDVWSRNSRPESDKWHERVQGALNDLGLSDESLIDDSPDGFRKMLGQVFHIAQGISFRFVAESSAAGLSGLRRSSDVDQGYLLKILVIDVGAGSTDIGYVIRSVPPEGADAKEVLCQLPPANTCPIAGDDLSRRVAEIYRSQGIDIGIDEAERRKISGEVDKDHPAIKDWSKSIADHVRAYVSRLPDERWLPEKPELHVLVTGGSGIVAGLREEAVRGVRQGLKDRGVSHSVADATSLMSLSLQGPQAREANRLAVALGTRLSEDLPKLSYHQELKKRMDRPTFRVQPSWTG